MRIYLTGPMSGYPNFNYPAFSRVAAVLRDCGYTVLNPAEFLLGWQGLPWIVYIVVDLFVLVFMGDAVARLRGWEKSRGSRIEIWVAEKLKKPVGNWEWYLTVHPMIAEREKRQ